MKHLQRIPVALLLGLVCAPAATTGAVEPLPAKQIQQWIHELDDDHFPVREAATRNLVKAGKAAVEAVGTAATTGSLEVTERAVNVLKELSFSADAAVAAAARQALTRLAGSDNAPAARRAHAALRSHVQQIIGELERTGARVHIDGDRVLGVDFINAKEFRGTLRSCTGSRTWKLFR